MKSLVRTITVFAILNLTVTGLALAQAVSTPPEPAPAPTTPEPAQVEAVETAAKEAQLEAAREQMEASRWQMDTTREQIERAKNTGGKALSKLTKDITELRFNIGMPFSRSGAGTVFVIPTSEMKAEDLATIVEDMTVMACIFDKQLEQDEARPPSWFSGHFMGQSGRTAETMYLQGYGALFLNKVGFPLSPGPTVQEEEKQTPKEDVDPVWEQMRQEIYEPQEERRRRTEREEEKYDAEKVENLKTNIIKALKHATNIRNLKPDESVILTVTGSDSSYSGYGSRGSYGMALSGRGQAIVQNKGDKSLSIITPTLPGDLGSSSPTILIIRAKKSDIESFAKGDLDFDKFRERVLIFTQ